MKLNELIKPVDGIAVAVVPEYEEQPSDWNVYIVNLKSDTIRNVLISTSGYGLIGEKSYKTSTLRYFYDEIPALSFAKIEPIVEDVFGLSNEYWVSFSLGNDMYDKRFIFLPETIQSVNFSTVPILQKRGVMIK